MCKGKGPNESQIFLSTMILGYWPIPYNQTTMIITLLSPYRVALKDYFKK